VLEAYRIASAQDVSGACVFLVENAPGRTWTTATVRRMLANRSYLGESNNGSVVNLDAQDPLVSLSEWTIARSADRDTEASVGRRALRHLVDLESIIRRPSEVLHW
jgi:hypothetical protein